MSRLNLNSTLANLRTDFDEYYEFGTIIGRGKYAVVKKCYCKQSKRCYAAKVIRKFRAIDNHLKMNIVENEINALKLVQSHPSIVNLYEVFHHKDEVILLLEYATQHDLQPYLGLFDEEIACFIIYQVLKAIEYLHSKNIIHLDIKPENVLLMVPIDTKLNARKNKKKANSDEDDDEEDEVDEDDDDVNDVDNNESDEIENSENSDENNNNNNNENDVNEKLTFDKIKVKLCDFSFSQVMTAGKKILGMMGTVAYSAPEVLEFDALTKATDMWSLGVLTHVLLTSYTPFGNGTEKDCSTQTNILNTRSETFECDESFFENISEEAKNFIEQLLIYRPRQRLTVEQALNHEWFKKWNIKSKINELVDLETSNHRQSTITNARTTSISTTASTVQQQNDTTKIVKNEKVEIKTISTGKEDIVTINVDTDAKITIPNAQLANSYSTQSQSSITSSASSSNTNQYSFHSHLQQIHHHYHQYHHHHHHHHYNHLIHDDNDRTTTTTTTTNDDYLKNANENNTIATAAL